MAAEGEFPKSDGDILYASEVNLFYNRVQIDDSVEDTTIDTDFIAGETLLKTIIYTPAEDDDMILGVKAVLSAKTVANSYVIRTEVVAETGQATSSTSLSTPSKTNTSYEEETFFIPVSSLGLVGGFTVNIYANPSNNVETALKDVTISTYYISGEDIKTNLSSANYGSWT